MSDVQLIKKELKQELLELTNQVVNARNELSDLASKKMDFLNEQNKQAEESVKETIKLASSTLLEAEACIKTIQEYSNILVDFTKEVVVISDNLDKEKQRFSEDKTNNRQLLEAKLAELRIKENELKGLKVMLEAEEKTILDRKKGQDDREKWLNSQNHALASGFEELKQIRNKLNLNK